MQDILSRLVTLMALAKEVHWNAKGQGFLYIHDYLDVIYDDSAKHADKLAEYMVYSGYGVPRWILNEYESFPQSLISDNNIVTGIRQVREHINELAGVLENELANYDDPVGADILTQMQATFYEHLWKLTSELR